MFRICALITSVTLGVCVFIVFIGSDDVWRLMIALPCIQAAVVLVHLKRFRHVPPPAMQMVYFLLVSFLCLFNIMLVDDTMYHTIDVLVLGACHALMSLCFLISTLCHQACPICFENVLLDTLPCGHSMCTECLVRWAEALESRPVTCPICRQHIQHTV